MTRSATRFMLWAAAAVSAVVIASVAVAAAVGGAPAALTDDEVARRLAVGASANAASANAASPGPTVIASGGGVPGGGAGAGGNEMLRTASGNVVASCSVTGLATLASWTPNPGYRADDVIRGPAMKASVWFESDVADDVLVEVVCVAGKPSATELPEADDHGGRRGDDLSGKGRDHPEDS